MIDSPFFFSLFVKHLLLSFFILSAWKKIFINILSRNDVKLLRSTKRWYGSITRFCLFVVIGFYTTRAYRSVVDILETELPFSQPIVGSTRGDSGLFENLISILRTKRVLLSRSVIACDYYDRAIKSRETATN